MVNIGFGIGDISPAAGMEMPGGFAKRLGKGVRDPLLAVACVVHDGATPVALVGIDALFASKAVTDHARRLIQARTRIPGDNVLIGANHTHTGGPVATCFGCEENPAYLDHLAKAIAASVTDAWNSLHTGELLIGAGRAEGIAFNRRFLMRDGREITHPGKPGTPHHQEIVAVAGPTDPEVGVLAARGPKGEIRGVFVHFTCHSTVVGGDLFSPDYAGYLRKHLQARYGAGVPVGFLLGPCGNITQVDNLSRARESGPEYADMMGGRLAAEAIRVISRGEWLKEARTGVHLETVPVSIRPEPDVERERPPFGLGSGQEEVYASERKHVAERRRANPIIPAEVQALRIGPLGIASSGAEYFVEFGLRIKQCSPHGSTWVVAYANDYLGYVPTPQAFFAGGYEPRTARSSMLAMDAGQRIVEASLKGLGKVAQGKTW